MATCGQVALSNGSSCLCQTSMTYVALPTLYATMFLTGLFGNVLSLWVFMAKISDKTPTHIYLINLGISNLILCLIMPFNAAYYALGASWQARSTMCKLAINGLTPVLHANISGGMLILTWLALSRFAILIQHNHGKRPSRCTRILPDVFLSRLRQRPFAFGMCTGTWAIVAAGIIPSVVMYSTTETDEREDSKEQVCYNVAVEVGGSGSQAFSLTAVVLFFICLLLVLSAYVAVIRHFYRSRKGSVISDKQSVYSKVFRNIVVIQVVLVVCLLPHHVYKAVFIYLAQYFSQRWEHQQKCHPLSVYVEIKNGLLCLATLRCSTDPIMYFLLDKTFKKHTRSLFRGNNNIQESQSSKTMLEGGQAGQFDSPSSKVVVTNYAHSRSKD